MGSRRTLCICLVQSTLALVLVIFASKLWMFYMFAVMFGLAYGGIMTLMTIVPAELFGVKSLGIITGTL
jgi:MFS family permease